jgi:hypothetical protein
VSSKYAALLVVLETNVSEGEAEALRAALYRFKGVVDVSPVEGDLALHVAEKRMDALWREKLINLIKGSL